MSRLDITPLTAYITDSQSNLDDIQDNPDLSEEDKKALIMTAYQNLADLNADIKKIHAAWRKKYNFTAKQVSEYILATDGDEPVESVPEEDETKVPMSPAPQ